MDPRTVQYYDENADAVFAQFSSGRSGVEKYFRLAFPPGSEILDIDTGSDRDLDILICEEYETHGCETSQPRTSPGLQDESTLAAYRACPHRSTGSSTASSAPQFFSTSRKSSNSTPPSTSGIS
jgi:hypothetical protein